MRVTKRHRRAQVETDRRGADKAKRREERRWKRYEFNTAIQSDEAKRRQARNAVRAMKQQQRREEWLRENRPRPIGSLADIAEARKQ